MPPRPRLIAHDIYRRSSYGGRHPLAIARVSAALDLIRAMGWLEEDQYVVSPEATLDELGRFHAPDYLAALQAAERSQRADPETRRRYNFGVNGNPISPEMFRRPATSCGGTLKAAELLLRMEGSSIISPAAPIMADATAPAAFAISMTWRSESCASWMAASAVSSMSISTPIMETGWRRPSPAMGAS